MTPQQETVLPWAAFLARCPWHPRLPFVQEWYGQQTSTEDYEGRLTLYVPSDIGEQYWMRYVPRVQPPWMSYRLEIVRVTGCPVEARVAWRPEDYH